jgi:hypothetical protein
MKTSPHESRRLRFAVALFGLSVLRCLSNLPAHASAPDCPILFIGEVCNKKALNKCEKPLKTGIQTIEDKVIPDLLLEVKTAPERLKSCQAHVDQLKVSQLADLEMLGVQKGAVQTLSRTESALTAVIQELETERSQFAQLRPTVEDSFPLVLSEIRSFFKTHDLLLQSQIADLTEELLQETDSAKRGLLEFRLDSLNELLVFRLEPQGDQRLLALLSEESDPVAPEDLRKRSFSPLTRGLFESLREGFNDYVSGRLALRAIENTWVRTEMRLKLFLEEARLDLAHRHQLIPELDERMLQRDRVIQRESRLCDRIRTVHDSENRERIEQQEMNVKKMKKQLRECHEDECRSCFIL